LTRITRENERLRTGEQTHPAKVSVIVVSKCAPFTKTETAPAINSCRRPWALAVTPRLSVIAVQRLDRRRWNLPAWSHVFVSGTWRHLPEGKPPSVRLSNTRPSRAA
jgi:hypothetical protein